MNDDYFKLMAEAVMENYDDATPAAFQRDIYLTLKEVARDVRHSAANMALRLSSDIHNMRDLKTLDD